MSLTLHTFTGSDGQNVNGPHPTDGNFYGSSQSGGANNLGVVFKMTATGARVKTVLHSFAGSDGAAGRWDLLQAKDGNFYGVALNGGRQRSRSDLQDHQRGRVYRASIASPIPGRNQYYLTISVLRPDPGHRMACSTAIPQLGGPWAFGSIYSFNPTTLAYTTLYNFTGGTDGGQPYGALIQHTDGLLYRHHLRGR